MLWITDHSSLFRILFFSIGLVLFITLERLFPFKSSRPFKQSFSNVAMSVINTLLVRLVAPSVLIGVSFFAEARSSGLINIFGVNSVLSIVLSILILDFTIYWQHRAFHKIPLLWKIHRVHHSDHFLDASSALRFHFLEILLSFVIKLIVVASLGISPIALIIFEALLNFSAMFNHANFSLGERLDPLLSKLFVTPSFHRVHHYKSIEEQNANFGFCLSIWDFIFKSFISYRDQEQRLRELGLQKFNEKPQIKLLELLKQPFI